MNRQLSLQRPIVSIDLKRNCIRIHRLTLHLLGDPEYIQLLINPESKKIALCPSIKQDYLAHHVRPSLLKTKNCYELYSTDLMSTLRKFDCGWKGNCAYRIYGTMDRQQSIALFSMNDTVLLNNMTADCNGGSHEPN
jgi:hypothetical protein